MIKFNTFVEQKENNSIENNLYEMLTFNEFISKELQNSGEIELIHYQKWKDYMNKYEATKLNLNKIENSMIIEEIQKSKEKIMNFISSLKEYEFISDYFTFRDNNNEQEEISAKKIEDKKNYSEKFLKIKESVENHFDSQQIPKNIFDLLALSSNEYLKEKLNLDEEQIQNLKGKDNEGIKEKEKHMEIKIARKEEAPTLKTNQKLNKILKIKSDLSQKNKISSLISNQKQSSSKFDKEMEEEINKEIFSYTRNMKNYARNFGEIISTDNKKLTKIEKIQEKDKNLTDASMKKLNEFHYDLKIGFFKLIIMFIIVIGAFITTLMTIRIFPKLVK